MQRRQQATIGILVATALLAVLAAPMLLGHVYVADDLGEFHLPMRAFYSKQLAQDEPFDWCPDLYCGFYLSGEGQIGGYHPLHLLLYHTMPLSLAFDLECWLSYPAMLIGMVMLLRRLRLPMPAALIGAIAFAFGSFNLLHFVHPNSVAVIAHLPWLLWAMDIMLRSINPRHRGLAFATVAALTGSQWLLGYPQYVGYSLGVEAGYLIFQIAIRSGSNATTAIFQTFQWLAAIALGTLIGSAQLLPTVDALQNSVRQDAANLLADRGSMHPLNVLQLIAPYAFKTRVVGQNTHELGLYIGAVPLVLAALAAICAFGMRRYRAIAAAAIITAVFSFVWALGDYGPFGWFQANVPLLNKFRLPCRAIVILQLATAVLAAIGFSILCRPSSNETEPSSNFPMAWLWLPAIASVGTAVAAPLLWPSYSSEWPCLAVGPAAIVVAVGLAALASRGASWALPTMILLTAIDLGTYGMSYAINGKTSPLAEFIRSTNSPPGSPDSRVALDLLGGTQAAPGDGAIRMGNRILLTGWKRVDGYAGLEPARRLDYQETAALRLAGVGWILQAASARSTWIARPDHQPRAWLVTQAIVSNDPAADVLDLPIQHAALADSPINLPDGTPGEVAIVHDRPGTLSFEIDCATAQLLIINESYHPGWLGAIHGKKAQIHRVNGDFLGILVPAGRHEILLEFAPASLRIGRIVSGCGLGFLVTVLLFATAKSRRLPLPPDASPPSAAER